MLPLTLELLATAKAVPDVRRTVCEHLGDAFCPHLELCVSELLANVIRHLGEGVPVTVRVVHGQGRTRVEVTDPAPRALPVLRVAAADDEGGRGLALLDAVTLRWGVDHGPGTKTVWCELPQGPPASPRRQTRSSLVP
ncbi:ATP-binding protein [Streptomyces sp. NPDC007883]|uniref:ATP-binding protein n=1 Tax=Streptomyces sp. NPDC007883 TaxID=3155116 RepID=UPI0033EA6E0B